MKWSIFEFSQAEITKLNNNHPDNKIDLVDLVILQWFKDFSSKTHAINKNKQSTKKGMWTKQLDGDLYYYVNYKALIDEFPMIEIKSERAIGRRFDKYVECGLMVKKMYHAGQKGAFPFFNLTETFFSLLYDDTNDAQKLNPNTKSTVDSEVQCKSSTVDSEVQCFKYNSTIKFKNSTTTHNPSNNLDIQRIHNHVELKKTEGEGVFLSQIIKIFGYNPKFTPDPYPELVLNMTNVQIPLEYITDYLDWLYKTLKSTCKNQESFVSYFYKSLTKEFNLTKFWFDKSQEIEDKAAKESRMIICPVCGKRHDKTDVICPQCNLSRDYLDSPEDLKKEKALYQLKNTKPDLFEEYNNEINKLWNDYPMINRLQNKKLENEYQQKIKLVEDKYLQLESA